MVTLEESADAFKERYHGYLDKGMETLKASGAYLNGEPREHDARHLIASGVLDNRAFVSEVRSAQDIAWRLAKIENAGGVSAAAGIKAELLETVYDKVFSRLLHYSTVYPDDIKPQLEKDSIGIYAAILSYVSNCHHRKERISHNSALAESMLNEISDSPKLSNFVSDTELEFHIKKASALFRRITVQHPEFIRQCGLFSVFDWDKAMECDVNDFAIDNLPYALKEKVKEGKGRALSSYELI